MTDSSMKEVKANLGAPVVRPALGTSPLATIPRLRDETGFLILFILYIPVKIQISIR